MIENEANELWHINTIKLHFVTYMYTALVLMILPINSKNLGVNTLRKDSSDVD